MTNDEVHAFLIGHWSFENSYQQTPAEGIEPSSFGLTDRRLTIWHHRINKAVSKPGVAPSSQLLIPGSSRGACPHFENTASQDGRI